MKGVLEVSHVLQSSADPLTGMITCQLGDVVSGEVYEANATVIQHWGLLSMGAAPVAGVSAPEAFSQKTGSSDVVLAGRSVRSGEIAGLIAAGETCLFADGSRASILCKLDGSIRLVTTHDNTSAGRTVYASVAPTTGIDLSTPWSRLTVSDLGIHGHCVRADGSSGAYFDLGSVVGLPAPFDAMGTYLSMGANLVRIEGQMIPLGTDAGAAEPVAKATTLIAVLATLSAALTNLSTALTELAAPAGALATATAGPAVATPHFVATLSAAVSAITTATGAIGAASAGAAPGPVASLASANVTAT